MDFTAINQSLHGELSRLANYEKWVKSHIVLLENVLKGPEFIIREEENAKWIAIYYLPKMWKSINTKSMVNPY